MAISTSNATALCSDVELSEEARALLTEEHGPRQFIDTLIEAGQYLEAIKVLARALPKLHAVQWACSCVRSELGTEPSDSEAACLTAAEQWVADPVEDKRRAAFDVAAATDYDTASSWVAQAAGWSGGSMGPPDVPPIPPPEHLTALAAAGAIGLVAALDPDNIDERQQEALRKGLDLAELPDPVMPEPATPATPAGAQPS